MKKQFHMLFLAVLMMFASWSKAQDIHFSQFNASPLTLNPAMAGVLLCDYRFVANYKNQWSSVTTPYRTLNASYDMRLQRKSTYDSYGSIGVNFFADKAGDSEFSTNKLDLFLSYNKALNSRGDQFVSVAIQGGIAQRSINEAALTFDSEWTEGVKEVIPSNNYIFGDVGLGALWYYTPQKKANSFYAGMGLWHLNQPVQSFFGDPTDKLYSRMVIHGGGQLGLGKQFFMMPSAVYYKQGPHYELTFGSYFKFKRSVKKNDMTAFYIGSWYRMGDAMVAAVRVDMSRINIGLSYDFNISSLSNASHTLGGIELSLIYQGCFTNKKLSVFCPVL